MIEENEWTKSAVDLFGKCIFEWFPLLRIKWKKNGLAIDLDDELDLIFVVRSTSVVLPRGDPLCNSPLVLSEALLEGSMAKQVFFILIEILIRKQQNSSGPHNTRLKKNNNKWRCMPVAAICILICLFFYSELRMKDWWQSKHTLFYAYVQRHAILQFYIHNVELCCSCSSHLLTILWRLQNLLFRSVTLSSRF